MAEENKQSSGNIVSKKDLGNGRKEVTFSIDNTKLLDQYTATLDEQGLDYEVREDIRIGKGSVRQRAIANAPSNIRSRYFPSASDYFLEYFNSNDKPYSFALMTPIDPHDKIRLAIELYYKEPIIGNVIDMMVDFSASGFEIVSEDADVKNMFDEWAKDVKLHELIEQVFLEYYRSGNVAVWRTKDDAKVTLTKKSVGKKQPSKKVYKFPGGYTILNPMNVIVEGPLMFNQEVTYLQLSEDVVNTMQGWNGGDEVVQNMIPVPMLDQVDSNGRILLDSDHLTRILRKKQPYERYASPYVERVFEPVLYKQKLRQMDMSTIDGLVNQLVTVTVGNDDYPANDEDLEAIAELFQTPSKAYTIFWNHTLNVQFHEPQGMQALMADKYQQVNDDIYAGLGISRVLVDGSGGNFSSSWVSILSLVERLENGRQKVQHWIESEFKRVCEENGLDAVPKIRFDKMNLREDNYIRNVLLAMYDRGLLDEEDVLRETGRDYNSILETKKRNEKNEEYFVPPMQPFQGNNNGSPFKSGMNDGKPSGSPNKNGYTGDRQTNPETNQGNPPEPKSSSAYEKSIAYSTQLQEDYEIELKDYYETIQHDVASEVEKHKKKKEVLEAIVAGLLLGMFRSFSKIGEKYLNESYNHEVSHYVSSLDGRNLDSAKKDLYNWNDSYLHKLANDIKNDIISNMSQGKTSNEAVEKAFKSNAYRVKLIAEAGIVDSTRQAKILGNSIAGRKTATWKTHIDGKECATCRGLNGKAFNIEDIPPRTHSGCRCDLEFN